MTELSLFSPRTCNYLSAASRAVRRHVAVKTTAHRRSWISLVGLSTKPPLPTNQEALLSPYLPSHVQVIRELTFRHLTRNPADRGP